MKRPDFGNGSCRTYKGELLLADRSAKPPYRHTTTKMPVKKDRPRKKTCGAGGSSTRQTATKMAVRKDSEVFDTEVR